jgi:hypothetical protein
MVFGKDAKKKFLRLFPTRKIRDPDLQYVAAIITILGIGGLLIFLLISSISGMSIDQLGH